VFFLRIVIRSSFSLEFAFKRQANIPHHSCPPKGAMLAEFRWEHSLVRPREAQGCAFGGGHGKGEMAADSLDDSPGRLNGYLRDYKNFRR
jgi:hypothetical protein